MLRRVLGALLLLSPVSLQQSPDPVTDFCRRFGHQTAVVDNRLYIDGGLVNWNPISQHPANYSNQYLLYNDLDRVTSDGFPQLYANLSKNNPVPEVSGGVLWADEVNKVLYLYGGESQSAPDDFQLWAYDIILDQWNRTESSDANIQRVAWGAGVAVNEIGVGYYLGGWLSNSTEPSWDGDAQMMSTLIRYDMVANEWSNNTGPDATGRAEGAMVFIPASDGGLLIYFGGIMDPHGNGSVEASNMSTIFIYDMASSKWYTQQASGDIPEDRRRFCAGVTWPFDQSSYNIYLYGGAGIPPNNTGFDDVYILSLPSFTWIKWWPTEPGPGNPHNSLTCNVINGSQMFIIGGTFPTHDDCDSATVWGMHNLVLGQNGPQGAKWELFFPNVTEYEVPPAIINRIGGEPSGGATQTKPEDWDDRDLPVYFSRLAQFSTRSPTRVIPTATGAPRSSDDGGSSDTGAIIGGAVGGGVGALIVLGLLVWCCLRYRKRTKQTPEEPKQKPTPPAELAATRLSLVEAPSDAARGSGDVSTTDPTMCSTSPTQKSGVTHPSQQGFLAHDYPSGFAVSPDQGYNPTSRSPPHGLKAEMYYDHPAFQPQRSPHRPADYSPQVSPPLSHPSSPSWPTTHTQTSQPPGYQVSMPSYTSASSQHSNSPPRTAAIPDPNSPQQYPQPAPMPYDPNQHELHQQHFQPPSEPSLEARRGLQGDLSTNPSTATRSTGMERDASQSPSSQTGTWSSSYSAIHSQSQTPAHFYPSPRNAPTQQEEEDGQRGVVVRPSLPGAGGRGVKHTYMGGGSPTGGKFYEGEQ